MKQCLTPISLWSATDVYNAQCQIEQHFLKFSIPEDEYDPIIEEKLSSDCFAWAKGSVSKYKRCAASLKAMTGETNVKECTLCGCVVLDILQTKDRLCEFCNSIFRIKSS